MSERLPVLTGYVAEIPPSDLLQVLSLGRQFMVVNIHGSGNEFLGRIWIKSGVVVDAEIVPDEYGRNAFIQLLSHPMAHAYQVFSEAGAERLDQEPIGSMASLLVDAAVALDHAAHRMPKIMAEELAPVPVPTAVPIETPVTATKPPPPASPRTATIIAFASPKGGVGKTTMALNLGLALAQRGWRTLLVDADPQGGVGHSLAGKTRHQAGVYDVMLRGAGLEQAIRATKLTNYRILPAGGAPWEDDPNLRAHTENPAAWRALLSAAGTDSDVVIVDTPAGLFGPTQAVLGASDYVVGVVQAEALALRSIAMLPKAVDQVRARGGNTKLAGVILNMTGRDAPSALQELHATLPPNTLLRATVARHDIYPTASDQGVPVAFIGGDDAWPVARTMDELAIELEQRLELQATAESASALMLE